MVFYFLLILVLYNLKSFDLIYMDLDFMLDYIDFNNTCHLASGAAKKRLEQIKNDYAVSKNRRDPFQSNLDRRERRKDVSLEKVLQFAKLGRAYKFFLRQAKYAQYGFKHNDTVYTYSALYKLWMHPRVVPALALRECYNRRSCHLPAWKGPWKLSMVYLPKSSGGFRPIIVPNDNTLISMGVLNTLFQISCNSWSPNTFGFRVGFGTLHALKALQNNVKPFILNNQLDFCVVMFDIHAAFNTVNPGLLFRTLGLNNLPHSMKKLIWEWHHAYIQPAGVSNLQFEKIKQQYRLNADGGILGANGLPQGFSYCPTLFAWYLDTIMIKNSAHNWIAYADNVAAVFPNRELACIALREAEATLALHGFSIKQDSVKFYSFPETFAWLGHGLDLKTCSILENKFLALPDASSITPRRVKKMTLRDWKILLGASNWCHVVINSNWRFL
jgi:hypothetical protein